MEAKKNMFVYVAGILMIIGGIVGLIAGVIALAGGAFLGAVGLGAFGAILVIAAVVAIITAIITLVAGVTGTKNAANPAKAPTLVKYGYITIGLAVIGIILNIVGGAFSGTSVVSLIIPIIYLLGAMQMKKEAGL